MMYESTTARKPHSGRTDKKRTPEFVEEILAMIDNDLSQSVRFIARDVVVWEFLIRQVVHEDMKYFSYKEVSRNHILY